MLRQYWIPKERKFDYASPTEPKLFPEKYLTLVEAEPVSSEISSLRQRIRDLEQDAANNYARGFNEGYAEGIGDARQ